MEIAEGYVLRNLKGINYLLPIGQSIALHKKSIQLNETGVLLWKAILQGSDIEDLLPFLLRYYKAAEADIPSLKSDIDSFLNTLTSLNLIAEDTRLSECLHYFNIGQIMVGYHGPANLLHPSLLDFTCEAASIDQHWLIEPPPALMLPIGKTLIRTHEIEVSLSGEDYIVTYFPVAQLIKVRISQDGSQAHFYCVPPYEEVLADKLFHAFRLAFLICAQKKGVFALHSSSILYQNKAWLFAGSSGTGKSTHTGLWNDLFQTRILNGDLNLISINASQPIVWGIPWCGTSGIYTATPWPLGGIILLKQQMEDKLQPLEDSEKQLMVMQRLISAAWTEDMLDDNLDFCGRLVELVPVYRLLCTKEPSAAFTMKRFLDETMIE